MASSFCQISALYIRLPAKGTKLSFDDHISLSDQALGSLSAAQLDWLMPVMSREVGFVAVVDGEGKMIQIIEGSTGQMTENLLINFHLYLFVSGSCQDK